MVPLGACLVSHWMENGNIIQYLRERAPDAHRIPNLVRSFRCLHRIYSNCNRSIQLFDIAQGLRYLHGKNVIHGDLKAVSLLI